MEEDRIKRQLSNFIRSISEVEAYLDYCMNGLEKNLNYRLRKNKEMLINRVDKWSVLLGKEPVENGCKIVDYNFIRLLSKHEGNENVFWIGSADGCETIFYIPEDSNNCYCDFFKEKVIGTNEAYLCEHLVAIRISKLMGIKPVAELDFKISTEEC